LPIEAARQGTFDFDSLANLLGPLLAAAGKRSFLDQSNARVFSITFAVVIRFVLGAIFVIVADAERTAEFVAAGPCRAGRRLRAGRAGVRADACPARAG